MIQDIIQAFCEFFLYTLDKFGLPWLWNTVSMNLAQKKHGHITPLPPLNGHLSTTATFCCPQDSRCREVRL